MISSLVLMYTLKYQSDALNICSICQICLNRRWKDMLIVIKKRLYLEITLEKWKKEGNAEKMAPWVKSFSGYQGLSSYLKYLGKTECHSTSL